MGLEGTGDGQFIQPEAVCVDDDGNVYVADYWNHRIQKFAPIGSISPAVTFTAVQNRGKAPFTVRFLDQSPALVREWKWSYTNGNGWVEFSNIKIPGVYVYRSRDIFHPAHRDE